MNVESRNGSISTGDHVKLQRQKRVLRTIFKNLEKFELDWCSQLGVAERVNLTGGHLRLQRERRVLRTIPDFYLVLMEN